MLDQTRRTSVTDLLDPEFNFDPAKALKQRAGRCRCE